MIGVQAKIVKQGLDLGRVMTLVAEQACAITGAAGAVVELAEGQEMVYRAVAGAASGLLGMRLNRESSLSGLCVAAAESMRCDDSETDSRVDSEACRRVGLRSMIVVPLIHNGNAVGVLKTFSPRPSAFADEDIQVLNLMSELIAASMFHAARFGSNELFRKATSDHLTGLANRALFEDRLRLGMSVCKREGRHLAVLVLDMDGLKPINDRHGHRAGDAAIREIAARIVAETRESDTVARLGGDEFGVILSEIDARASAHAVVQRIRARCNQPFVFDGKSFPIGASMGAAIYPDDADEPHDLVEKADQAMYGDKRTRQHAA